MAHLCLARKGKQVATRHARAQLTHLATLADPLPVEEWVEATEAASRGELDAAIAESGRRIPPKAWAAARASLVALRPEAERLLAVLEALLNPQLHLSPGEGQVLTEQKDAVGLAVQAAGLFRPIIDQWRLPDRQDAVLPPWLAGIRPGTIREDTAVIHDAGRLPGWFPAGEPYVGVVQFTNRSGRRVTIMNVNRLPLEHVTGVDLVYYQHEAHSFTMVQYKRLLGEPDAVFRPSADRNFMVELERMRAIEAPPPADPWETLLPGDDADPGPDREPVWDYRLSERTCWLKLCRPEGFVPMGSELIRGQYLPIDLYDTLAGSGALLGPRGGIVLSEDRPGRWIKNTLFTELMGGGWIGSRTLTSDRIGRLVRQSLEGGRSLVLAAASSGPPGDRDRR